MIHPRIEVTDGVIYERCVNWFYSNNSLYSWWHQGISSHRIRVILYNFRTFFMDIGKVNSLHPERWQFWIVISELMWQIKFMSTSCDNALNAGSVQVMTWCRQAPSHYLSQCWSISMLPYGITRPQWVDDVFLLHIDVLMQRRLYFHLLMHCSYVFFALGHPYSFRLLPACQTSPFTFFEHQHQASASLILYWHHWSVYKRLIMLI